MKSEDLIKKITEKKELSGLSKEVILKEIEKYLKKENISLLNIKEKDEKLIISAIRSKLRRMTGQFTSNSSDENNLMHKSSSEREDIYPTLKEIIKKLNAKSILDLGCGLNPIFIANKEMVYHAYDINESDLNKIKLFFDKNRISGETKICDLRENSSDFPKTDVCLILKVLDLIEHKGHKLAESIIKRINSDYIIISFPTKTLSGRPMNHPQRGWIELLLKRLGFNYICFKGFNEIFYLSSREKVLPQSIPGTQLVSK